MPWIAPPRRSSGPSARVVELGEEARGRLVLRGLVEGQHAQPRDAAVGREHDQEGFGQRAHGVHVDQRSAEQLFAAEALVQRHQLALELCSGEPLDRPHLRLVEHGALLLDPVGAREGEGERLALAQEHLRRRRRGDEEPEQRENRAL